MCLKVATKKLVAETDLLVFKCLDYDGYGNYCTPFQYYPVKFDGGQCTIKGGDNALTTDNGWDPQIGHYKIIRYGVHAFVSREKAVDVARNFVETKTHYAVIPKGNFYYRGIDFDIVTTDMIVFRSKRAFEKYTKEHEVKKV